ncbi:DUF349 domain-containing protein [Maribacter hydrothermalis]|uniref:Chromosome segregation protein n=1 Tax=Maribacter hydrothermalis TaxID=1836467 RepID=A0A1B7ZDJ8_9FLAO|nr:DUF349 domain-containing protein [Maribacter hydrothermalis]APQ18408.1 chromosome segregation protein [Maribacter hydrothermalis]OBR41385.1 chromosome segregation protein [Maribacter hydrothermalis]
MSEEKKQQLPETSKEEKTIIKSTVNLEEGTVEKNETSTESQKDSIADQNTIVVETDVINEIDDSNAEDAEDTDTVKRHEIPMPEYHEMSMENLVGELQRLVKNEKVQAIRKHVDTIKDEFNQKFDEFLEGKKEEFITSGGNEIDFRYNSVAKRQFNEVYNEYREKRNQHYKSLEKSHKENLAYRLDLIEQLKALVNVEEDINTTYNNFKDIQAKWRHAGPIPKADYNNVWKTYHHHIEIFYDFLNINRELRDLDFKHNLEEKSKIVARAEELAKEPDLNRAFRELQVLHKIWKEDLGPVGKDHREDIWDKFSAATKTIHERRQDFFKNLDKIKEKNLARKNALIEDINNISANVSSNHGTLQQQIKKIEELRDAFFKAGQVPQKLNSKTWNSFKTAVRNFNQNKNAFYKNLKKDQQENLDKKRALLEVALSLKESEDWDSTTSEMKRIQGEWKKVGHVPRKYSDKLWKDFKNACNHYFDRLNALKNDAFKEEEANYKQKDAFIERLKSFELSGEKEKDLASIKEFSEEWKTYGRVPFKKKNINQKFDKIIDALFQKMGISKQQSELLKYGNKIQQLTDTDNKERAIQNERTFIRKKIDESKDEIRQLENNLDFFSNASESNPIVQDVIKRVNQHKESLAAWKAKLKKLNILKNNLEKDVEDIENSEE